MQFPIPPTDGRRLWDFYHNWTNSILQQLKRKYWKIADALFRISSMTDSFKQKPREGKYGAATGQTAEASCTACGGFYCPYCLVPEPQISENCESSDIPMCGVRLVKKYVMILLQQNKKGESQGQMSARNT